MAGETLGFQVHHIFPTTALKGLEDTFKSIGINISANDYSNRINLFNNQAILGHFTKFSKFM